MAEAFSLKDHLFNAQTVGQLAAEYADAVPGFEAERFVADCLGGFAERELMARMAWMADCLEQQLASDFPTLADQLEAAMPPPLDPARTDDDFGHFIHAMPGILAERHGLEDHPARALDLLHAATQRFSMEFYIRAFLNRWPERTLARLADWAGDENYHVRRLVSEGTRPKLPWAKAVTLTTAQRVPLLTQLHADPTRYVTRSVANHLNDISKSEPEVVLALLRDWQGRGQQRKAELDWMIRHALRTLIKQGHGGALDMLGYRQDVPVRARLVIASERIRMGDPLEFEVLLEADEALPVLVDYRIRFARASGKPSEKVFKLKKGQIPAGAPLVLSKRHKLKAGASTFSLHPGAHVLTLQVNGQDAATAGFELY